MRNVTARTAEINKNAVIKIANRTGEVIKLPYNVEQYIYGDIQAIECCLMPFDNAYQAQAYGVSLIGGKKVSLTVEQAKLFNEFTHIWVDKEPPTDKQYPEYKVRQISITLNNGVLILDKVEGNNAV